MPFVEYFLSIGFIDQEDVKYYFDRRPFQGLERVSHSQFSSMFEPLLLLEYWPHIPIVAAR
jgi:hypothetical protein